jgi:hypothetical protein
MRWLETELSRTASEELCDPPGTLRMRTMEAVRRAKPHHHGASGAWRLLAAAACVMIVAGLVIQLMFNTSLTGGESVELGGTRGERVVAGGPADGSNDLNRNSRASNTLAALSLFLEDPTAIESGITQPLQVEWDRLASAGQEIIQTAMPRLPRSLRAAER